MTAVDVDALDKLREEIRQTIDDETLMRTGRPVGDLASGYVADAVLALPGVADLIADARKYRALREAVDGLAENLAHEAAVQQSAEYAWGMRHAVADLRAVVAAVDGGEQQ